jgi:hypothetical protein
MRRECPVEVLCVSSPVSPRLWLHCVSSQGSAMGGWPLAVCYLPLKGQSRLGCQVPVRVYTRVCVVLQPEPRPDGECSAGPA